MYSSVDFSPLFFFWPFSAVLCRCVRAFELRQVMARHKHTLAHTQHARTTPNSRRVTHSAVDTKQQTQCPKASTTAVWVWVRAWWRRVCRWRVRPQVSEYLSVWGVECPRYRHLYPGIIGISFSRLKWANRESQHLKLPRSTPFTFELFSQLLGYPIRIQYAILSMYCCNDGSKFEIQSISDDNHVRAL